MNLYQTNRRKDEPNIVFVTRNGSGHYRTKHVKTYTSIGHNEHLETHELLEANSSALSMIFIK